MQRFMDENFLLRTETAKQLFAACKDEPIFDWHCHLSPKEIYENKTPADLTALWLAGDHYKWRAMRSIGISENYITGDATAYEKFEAWAGAMPYLIGNPLYHWTHLELQRYFGIYEPLSARTGKEIWDRSKTLIDGGGFEPRSLIEKSNVVCVATTDDPADSLEYHQLLAADKTFKCKVIPAFRPDKAIHIEQPAFAPWLGDLAARVGDPVDSYAALKAALTARMDFFQNMGCRASDQSLGVIPCAEATAAELETIFRKGANGDPLTAHEIAQYQTDILRFLGREYHAHGFAMELHIGALRNNNTAMFRRLGADAGFDSMDDLPTARGLSRLLDALAADGTLPQTILFTLNPIANYMLGSMIGNFQNDDAASKLQFGSAWWFNDNIDGMRAQMQALMNLGVISKFVGMVTDSRSFLSYPRHEYFRRILCALLGDLVENGEYPADLDALAEIVQGVAYRNAKAYFSLDI
ncbi:MAG: glucuronate isomerase [Clostridia bacterium]|nr:glucuronate isomerase [Clostridia bacterium]